jgi:hypothetical protein
MRCRPEGQLYMDEAGLAFSTGSEVIVTQGFEAYWPTISDNLNSVVRALYLSDFVNRGSLKAPRKKLRSFRRHGEQELVIFATVKGQIKRRAAKVDFQAPWTWNAL